MQLTVDTLKKVKNIDNINNKLRFNNFQICDLIVAIIFNNIQGFFY